MKTRKLRLTKKVAKRLVKAASREVRTGPNMVRVDFDGHHRYLFPGDSIVFDLASGERFSAKFDSIGELWLEPKAAESEATA